MRSVRALDGCHLPSSPNRSANDRVSALNDRWLAPKYLPMTCYCVAPMPDMVFFGGTPRRGWILTQVDGSSVRSVNPPARGERALRSAREHLGSARLARGAARSPPLEEQEVALLLYSKAIRVMILSVGHLGSIVRGKVFESRFLHPVPIRSIDRTMPLGAVCRGWWAPRGKV